MKFNSIFKKEHDIIIGAVHLPPLPGYPGFPGFDIAIENALRDAEALQRGGASGVIFENNYDIPHKVYVEPEVAEAMIRIGYEIKRHIGIPLGVSVLWNDYRAALTIAKELGLTFVRIPVFVDSVETSYGVVHGISEDVVSYRTSIKADEVALLTDIHVKHSRLLVEEPIKDAALRAVKAGSDALIVTGKWTGDAPDFNELTSVRESVGDFPILCGSGVDEQNMSKLFKYANGAIVSTSIKEDSQTHADEVNVKPYDSRISEQKTARLIASLRS